MGAPANAQAANPINKSRFISFLLLESLYCDRTRMSAEPLSSIGPLFLWHLFGVFGGRKISCGVELTKEADAVSAVAMSQGPPDPARSAKPSWA
jgi:hypothetical protein